MRIRVTETAGATGKVGQTLLSAPTAALPQAGVRAPLHNRGLPPRSGLTRVKGSLVDRAAVEAVVRDCTPVVHSATRKESPGEVMEVAVKGYHWLLAVSPGLPRIPPGSKLQSTWLSSEPTPGLQYPPTCHRKPGPTPARRTIRGGSGTQADPAPRGPQD